MTASRPHPIRSPTLLGRINRIYGLAARVDTVAGVQGNFGFIID